MQASGCENLGVLHVLNLHGTSKCSRRARGWRTSLRRRCVAAPPLKGGSGAVRPAQLAEAGSDSCHSFAALFEHCESHIARSHRVNVTSHENLSCSCDTGVHDATRVIRLGRNSGNSSNSWGDTEAGRHRFCVSGRTKSLSTSSRSMSPLIHSRRL